MVRSRRRRCLILSDGKIPHSLESQDKQVIADVLTVLREMSPPKPPSKIPHSPKSARSQWHRTEVYTSHGIKYVRYRWGKGKDTWGYLHIPGGSCTDDVVQSRRKMVEDAIALGDSPEQIKKLFLHWESAPAGRKPAF